MTERQQATREGVIVVLPAVQRQGKDDVTWQVRVAKALEARKRGAELRDGKPKSFRQVVGQV